MMEGWENITAPIEAKTTGCSSAWLERVVWDHEVAGSNPVTPTCHLKLR